MIYKSIAVQDGLRDDLLSQAVSTKVLGFINAGCEAGEHLRDVAIQRWMNNRLLLLEHSVSAHRRADSARDLS